MKDFIEDLNHKPYIIAIFIIVLLQAITLFFFYNLPYKPFPNAFTFLLLIGIINTYIPWWYFFKYANSDHSRFSKIYPNRKTVNTIMDSLDLSTFDYEDFQYEYFKFISKEPYDTNQHDDSSLPPPFPPLYYLIIHEDYGNDPKRRSEIAKRISLKDFCVALELKYLLLNKTNESRKLHFELHEGVSFSREESILRMAELHFRINFLYYLDDYYKSFSYEKYVLKNALIEFIGYCFFNRKCPSYEYFLTFCVTQSKEISFSINKDVLNNLKKLSSNIL